MSETSPPLYDISQLFAFHLKFSFLLCGSGRSSSTLDAFHEVARNHISRFMPALLMRKDPAYMQSVITIANITTRCLFVYVAVWSI